METIVIKKYSTRKYYDLSTRDYTNFSHIKTYISNGIPLLIIDQKTEKDITDEVVRNVYRPKAELNRVALHRKMRSDIQATREAFAKEFGVSFEELADVILRTFGYVIRQTLRPYELKTEINMLGKKEIQKAIRRAQQRKRREDYENYIPRGVLPAHIKAKHFDMGPVSSHVLDGI